MKKFHVAYILAIAAGLFSFMPGYAKSYELSSPDGKTDLIVEDNNQGLTFTVNHNGIQLLSPSPIALNFDKEENKKVTVKKSKIKKDITEKITAPFHHTPKYETTYNELNLDLSNGLKIEFRVLTMAWRIAMRIKIKTAGL